MHQVVFHHTYYLMTLILSIIFKLSCNNINSCNNLIQHLIISNSLLDDIQLGHPDLPNQITLATIAPV